MPLNWFSVWLSHSDKLWMDFWLRGWKSSALLLLHPLRESAGISTVLVSVQLCLAIFFYGLALWNLLAAFYCLKILLLAFPKALFLYFFPFCIGISQVELHI